MPRAKRAEGNRVNFWCPACDDAHTISHGNPPATWTWNESVNLPTFSPSVKVGGVQWKPEDAFFKPQHKVAPGKEIVCHSFVTDGQIQFLEDCTHSMAGQTVDLPEWPYDG